MADYTPTRVGYPCAAMVRYRPDAAGSNRIEIYPTSQWGLLGDYCGPENVELAWAVTALGRFHRRAIIAHEKADD